MSDPLFMQDAKKRAAERGVPVEQVLEEDRKAAHDPKYPTADCPIILTADEARDFVPSEEERKHMQGCPFCQTILRVMSLVRR